MAFKFVAFLALVSACSAGIVPAQPAHVVSYAAAAPAATYQAHHVAAPAAVYAHHAAPVAAVTHHHVLAKSDDEFDPHPQYKFAYDVQDSLSGDSKNQVEERDGDVVRGEYSLIDADGFKRTVSYTADDVNGFNAVVNRTPLEHHEHVKAYAPAQLAYQHHH